MFALLVVTRNKKLLLVAFLSALFCFSLAALNHTIPVIHAQGGNLITTTYTFDNSAQGWFVTTSTVGVQNGWADDGWFATNAISTPEHTGNGGGVFGVYKLEEGIGNGDENKNFALLWLDVQHIDTANYPITWTGYVINCFWQDCTTDITSKVHWETILEYTDGTTETTNHITNQSENTWVSMSETAGGLGTKIKRIGFAAGNESWISDERQNVYIDDVNIIVNEDAIDPGPAPGPACPALTDYSFNNSYSPSDITDAWLSPRLENGVVIASAPPITSGVAQIGRYDLITQQLFSTTNIYESYTVTLSARTVSDEDYNYQLMVGLSPDVESLAQYNDSYDPDDWPSAVYAQTPHIAKSDVFTTYTTTLYSLQSTDFNRWFFITGAGDDQFSLGDYVEIEWVCITPSGSAAICNVPNPVHFDLNSGNNYGDLFEDKYGVSQGWQGIEYADLYPDYTGPEKIPEWIGLVNLDPTVYIYPIGLFGKPAINFIADQAVAIQYLESVIPNKLTTTVIYPIGTDPDLAIYLRPEGETDFEIYQWLSVPGNAVISPTVVEVEFMKATMAYTFPTGLLFSPYEIALALQTTAGGSLGANRMGWDDITVSGCFPGDPLASECVLSDPELDEEGGYPSSFYWHGSYGPVTDGAYLNAGDNIFQNVNPPRDGPYRLSMLASSYLNGGPACDFTVDIRDYSSQLIVSSYDVQCKIGLVQSYTLNIDLPATPVEFMITQNTGAMQLDYICLNTPQAPNCINHNPIFLEGISNYNGDFTISGGQAIIAPGKNIQAIGVPYGWSQTSTYKLELIGAPVSSGTVDVRIMDDNSPPTVSTPGTAISSTTAITYIIDQQAVLAGIGPGVWNWNNTSGSDFVISQYCITPMSTTVWYGGKSCSTITNPDFDEGLAGWDANSVTNVGGWAIFDSGGSVSQVVDVDNLIPDPSFESGVAGWVTPWGDTKLQSADEVYHGNYSIKITAGGANSINGSHRPIAVSQNSTYTAGAWFYNPAGNTVDPFLRAYGDGWANLGSSSKVSSGAGWEFVTVTFNSGSNSSVKITLLQAGSIPNGEFFYADSVVLVAGPSIPIEYSTPQDATVHWIAKAPSNTPINATVSVSSTAGVFTSSHTVYGGFNGSQIFDNFQVGGDVEVTVTGGAGLELDYVCLIPGTYTEEGDPPGGGDGPIGDIGDGHCAPPPMAVMSTTLNSWLPSIWIWQGQANNYEVVATYSAAWLRYIGCTLTQIAELLDDKLTAIIRLLQTLTFLQALDTLASIISALADAVALLEETIDDLVDAITGPVATLLFILGLIALFIVALVGLITLIIGLILLVWLIPQTFWQSFVDALRSDTIVVMPLPDSEAHPLYNIFVGLQLFNGTFAPTWMFTFTVVAIALGSISLIIWTVKRVQVRW